MTKKSDGFLDVDCGHKIYWLKIGKQGGVPVVVVHGGPGGSMNLKWSQFFDLTIFELIFFDQRGCGRSLPTGRLEGNTIKDLVEDMEKIRAIVSCEKWILFGGSWGTTVAIQYGLTYPERCSAFLLRGIFLARQEENEFFLWNTRFMFPNSHAALLDAIEASVHKRPTNYQNFLQLAGDALKTENGERVAVRWSEYEIELSNLTSNILRNSIKASTEERGLITVGLLEHHYFANQFPLDILSNVSKIGHIPCWIVQGKLDFVCPVSQAIDLHKVWKRSELALVESSGHCTFEPGIQEKLYQFAKIIEKLFKKDE